jgi:hypothetical protein
MPNGRCYPSKRRCGNSLEIVQRLTLQEQTRGRLLLLVMGERGIAAKPDAVSRSSGHAERPFCASAGVGASRFHSSITVNIVHFPPRDIEVTIGENVLHRASLDHFKSVD